MPSLANKVASDAPTFSPALIRATLDVISTVPLLILVGMLRTCQQVSHVEHTLSPVRCWEALSMLQHKVDFVAQQCFMSEVCAVRGVLTQLLTCLSCTRPDHTVQYQVTNNVSQCTFVTAKPLRRQQTTGHTWKKLVDEGSRPVPPAGTSTSLGATRPTRAGAPTLNFMISSRIVFNSPCVPKRELGNDHQASNRHSCYARQQGSYCCENNTNIPDELL